MNDAIRTYHELLTDEVAQESQWMMEDQLRRRDLYFGDRALCTVLRPRLTGPGPLDLLQRRVRVLLAAMNRAFEAALMDRSLRDQFRLDPWEESVMEADPGFREPSPTSRLDAFLFDDTGQMRLTEFNAETPAGAAYTDALTEIFADLPIMREFERQYRVYPLPCTHGVFHALMEAYRQFTGRRGERPRIAIVDWPDVPTRSEFVLFERYFQGLGLSCAILDPRELEFREGRLMGGGGAIDLVYKRVLLSELVKECGLENPLVQAVRDRAVCMVNSFRGKLMTKKALLAVLSDEENAHLFSAEQREAIHAFVPWSRVVEERRTVYNGQPIDLVRFMMDHREWLVLKPNDDYGGAGIVLGWLAEPEEWESTIRKALEIPYIVQERVRIPSEPFPSVEEGRLRFYDRMMDTAPFVVHGTHMVGCLTRLATDALLNVTAGGGSTVPTFMVQKR